MDDARKVAIVDASMATIRELERRTGQAPSKAVQLKTVELMARSSAHAVRPSVTVEINSDGRLYPVALYIAEPATDDEIVNIIGARCKCDHGGVIDGGAIRLCSHLIAGLALARLDGYELAAELPE